MAATPQDRGGAVVWMSGGLISEEEARVSPFDHGLLVGDGVFETLAAHDGRIFAMSRHYDRLKKSAEVFGIEVPAKEELIEAGEAVSWFSLPTGARPPESCSRWLMCERAIPRQR